MSMFLRALCGLSFLLGGCTIHVVEQPLTPVATLPAPIEVASAPQARPHHRVHPTHVSPPPVVVVQQPTAQAPRIARPARSDMTAMPVASKPSTPTHSTKPPRVEPAQADKPLYTRFRDLGPQALPEPPSPFVPQPRPQPQPRQALKAGA